MASRRSTASRRFLTASELLQHLEPRRLLANTVVFDDVDGDKVTVKLTGPGEVQPILSGGASGYIDNLQLTGTTASSALSISVKTPAGVMGNGRVIMLGMSNVPLRSFKAPAVDPVGTFAVLLSSITEFVLGDLGAEVTFTLTPPVGKKVAINIRNHGGTLGVDGGVSTLRMQNMSSVADVVVGDSIGAVICPNNVEGALFADNYGSITVGDFFATLTARSADARGYSFGAIRFNFADGASLLEDNNAGFGRVRSITTNSDWNGGIIDVAGIDTLRIGDDFRPDTLRLRDENPAAFSIRSGTITDEAEGEWQLGSKVGTLRIGRTDELTVTSNSPNTHIGTLALTDPDTTSSGAWTVASIRTVNVKFEVVGEWNLFGLVPGTDRSINSFTARRVNDFDLTAEGAISAFTANEVDGSDVFARYFRTVNIRAGNGLSGNMLAGEFRAREGDSGNFSFRSFTVVGLSDDSTIVGSQNIGPVKFGRFLDTIVFAGKISPLAGFPVFGDTSELNADFGLTSFTVTQAFDVGILALGNGVRVTAGFIGRVNVNGFTSQSFNGGTHGFVAASFGPIKMRSLTGALITVTTTPSQDTNPFTPVASDFVFRHIVL